MIGAHCVKTWSSTQKTVALSSAEAELIAMVKTSIEALGIMQLQREWGGVDMGSRIFADSSAALGVVQRRGCGKLRHIRVGMLWVQHKRENGELEYQKVEGSRNPADLMTKHLGQQTLQAHCSVLSQDFPEGRAQQGLHLS